MGPVIPAVITIVLISLVAYACYLIFYRSQAKEINEEFDAKIKAEPHKAALYNMLRNIELHNEATASKYMHEYLTDRVQEELMWMEK